MFATVLLTGNNKPRSKVKRDCGAQILVCSSSEHCSHGTETGAHSIAGRQRQRQRTGSEAREYQNEQDQGQFHEDMLDWSSL